VVGTLGTLDQEVSQREVPAQRLGTTPPGPLMEFMKENRFYR
jgi:hypothetical protein